MFLEEKMVEEYKLYVLKAISPSLVSKESIQEILNVVLVKDRKMLKTSRCFICFTQLRLFICRFEQPDYQLTEIISYYLGDFNQREPFIVRAVSTRRDGDPVYFDLQFQTEGLNLGFILGVKPDDQRIFRKQLEPQSLQRLEEFQLVEEEIRGQILLLPENEDAKGFKIFDKLIVKQESKVVNYDQFWQTNQKLAESQSKLISAQQFKERASDEIIVEQLAKVIPQPQKQPFSMERIYEQKEKQIPENMYHVDLENDLIANLEDREEPYQKFIRHHPNKIKIPKDKKDRIKENEYAKQVEAYEKKKHMLTLDQAFEQNYLKSVVDVEETIHELANPNQNKIRPIEEELINKADFRQKLMNNDGLESFLPQQETKPEYKRQRNSSQHKGKQAIPWGEGAIEYLKQIKESEIYEQVTKIDAELVIKDSEKTNTISQKQIQKLEDNQKEFFQRFRSRYTEVKRLLHLLYLQQRGTENIRQLETQLASEKDEIRRFINMELTKPNKDNEMKRAMMEDLQKMIERGLNYLR